MALPKAKTKLPNWAQVPGKSLRTLRIPQSLPCGIPDVRDYSFGVGPEDPGGVKSFFYLSGVNNVPYFNCSRLGGTKLV